MTEPEMHPLLAQLRGLRCSGARIGVSQRLSFEFGQLDGNGIGDVSLWLEDSEWRIDTASGWIGSADDEQDLRPFILRIVGATVTSIAMGPNADLVIAFERGVVLRVFVVRHTDTDTANSWILYGETTIVSSAPNPPFIESEEGSLRLGPDIPFIRNVQNVFGDDAAKRLIKPDLKNLILPPGDDNDRRSK